ncbi:MAG TPA: hypothetical protein VMW04_04165 [Patescibacteria group bacterium]|nr:hypothetical protein [Patescibacteria group bacterium]
MKFRIILFILIPVFIIIVSAVGLSYFTLKKGDSYFDQGNYSQAAKFYQLSNILSLSLNKRAKVRMQNSLNELLKTGNNPSSLQSSLTIPLNEISVINKRVVSKDYSNGNRSITISAIVKNNSDIGIPAVNIKRITMYDEDHKKVAEKTEFEDGSFMIVGRGEMPFSLSFSVETPKLIEVKDFDLELKIPSFKPTSRSIRLKATNPVRLSTETSDVYLEKGKVYNFEYKTTLTNDTDKIVENIRRVSFLKHKGFTLTRIGEACCTQVSFRNDGGNSGGLNLNKVTYDYSLNPGESRDYIFKILTDPLLIDSLINPSEIELVTYFIGSTK